MMLTRIISVFNVKTEELIQEVNIDHIPFHSLKEIFNSESDDPMLIKPIHIKKEQMVAINHFLKKKIDYNDEVYIYQLDCFQA